MKNNFGRSLLKHLVFLFIVNTCQSQTIYSVKDKFNLEYANENNTYFKDTNGYFNKFIGTWQTTVDNTQLIIKIRKLDKVQMGTSDEGNSIMSGIVYEDLLQLDYYFVVDNRVIYNTYITNSNQSIPPDINFKMDGATYVSDDAIALQYEEPTENECGRTLSAYLILTVDPIDTKSINWKVYMTGRDSFCMNGGLPDNSDFKMPKNLNLQKMDQ